MNAIMKIHQQQQKEHRVALELLALVFGKPLEQLTQIPATWTECVHVDFQCSEPWPSNDVLLPIINNMVGMLAHRDRRPIDVAIVRRNGVWSLVVLPAKVKA